MQIVSFFTVTIPTTIIGGISATVQRIWNIVKSIFAYFQNMGIYLYESIFGSNIEDITSSVSSFGSNSPIPPHFEPLSASLSTTDQEDIVKVVQNKGDFFHINYDQHKETVYQMDPFAVIDYIASRGDLRALMLQKIDKWKTFMTTVMQKKLKETEQDIFTKTAKALTQHAYPEDPLSMQEAENILMGYYQTKNGEDFVRYILKIHTPTDNDRIQRLRSSSFE